jgi:F420-dependent oxidoreductase-like protein
VLISLCITNYSWRDDGGLPAGLTRIVHAADQGGLDTVWVADHLIQADPTAPPGDTEHLEAYTTLGFLAGLTERIKLGTMVTGVTFRPPALLVKAVTTLDVLSNGRARFGVGAGYQQDEAQAMDLPLPPMGERFERLEETLQLALRMWSGDDSPFEGRHYRLTRPQNSPNPVQRSHPPILVGGAGERRTLPLVARYADACNLFDIPDGGKTLRHKLGVLARLSEEFGRPYDEIEKTVTTRLAPGESAPAFADRCAAFANIGIDHVCVIGNGAWSEDGVAVLTEAASLQNLQQRSTR